MPSDRAQASSFERAMALRGCGQGRYEALIDPAWSGPRAPNGGVLAALMLRAAQAELDAQAPPPRTIACHYLAAPAPGPATLAVKVLRRGPRVSVCDVRLSDPAASRIACQATIVLSAARPQPTALAREAPAAPAPESLAALGAEAAARMPAMFSLLELRPVFGAPPFSGAEHALSGGWISLRGDRAALDAARLCALCDLWWPAVFSLLERPAAVPTIQLTVYLRRTAHPASGPVFARFETTVIAEGHLEESGELWSAAGELLAESRQLALLPAG